MGTRVRRTARPLLTETRRRPINYEALYASSSRSGSCRNSIGYETLREQAYAAQRRGYVLEPSSDDDEYEG